MSQKKRIKIWKKEIKNLKKRENIMIIKKKFIKKRITIKKVIE